MIESWTQNVLQSMCSISSLPDYDYAIVLFLLAGHGPCHIAALPWWKEEYHKGYIIKQKMWFGEFSTWRFDEPWASSVHVVAIIMFREKDICNQCKGSLISVYVHSS